MSIPSIYDVAGWCAQPTTLLHVFGSISPTFPPKVNCGNPKLPFWEFLFQFSSRLPKMWLKTELNRVIHP